MASRMIHFTIASLILQEFSQLNRNEFIIGNITPDIGKYVSPNISQQVTHFMTFYKIQGVRGCDLEQFHNRFIKNKPIDSFSIGYLTHLLCDNIWLKDIQDRFIYSFPKNKQQEILEKAYNDMQKCNYMFVEKYQLKYNLIPLETKILGIIPIDAQKILLKDLKDDFKKTNSSSNTLEIHDWFALTEYIEKCVYYCKQQIKNILKYNSINPYYNLMIEI